MTSNLGVHAARARIGFAAGSQSSGIEDVNEDAIQKEVGRFFRPEFLNRLSAVLSFRSLLTDDLLQILDLHVTRLNESLKSKSSSLRLTPAVTEMLIQKASQGGAGARDLERLFQHHVVVPLSKLIIERGSQATGKFLADFDNRTQSMVIHLKPVMSA
jgi:ATP-dependent Clp protease ATP-binding subunit ClpC